MSQGDLHEPVLVIGIASFRWRAVGKTETQNKGGVFRDIHKRWHFSSPCWLRVVDPCLRTLVFVLNRSPFVFV